MGGHAADKTAGHAFVDVRVAEEDGDWRCGHECFPVVSNIADGDCIEHTVSSGNEGRKRRRRSCDSEVIWRTVSPVVRMTLKIEKEYLETPDDSSFPQLAQRRWYFYFLHNMRSAMLKTRPYRRGNRRIVVVKVPRYLE